MNQIIFHSEAPVVDGVFGENNNDQDISWSHYIQLLYNIEFLVNKENQFVLPEPFSIRGSHCDFYFS